MVLLPQPLAPTSPVVFPAGMERLRPFSTAAPGLEGYENMRFLISIWPRSSVGVTPFRDRGSSCEGLSRISNSSAAADEALVKA